MLRSFHSYVSASLAVLGCIGALIAQVLKIRSQSILFAEIEEYTGDRSDLFGGYYEVGPPTFLLTDTRIFLIVLVAAAVLSVAATVIGFRQIRKGDSGHYAAAGTVGGALAILWVLKLAVLGA